MILFIRDNECFEPRVRNYLRYYDKHGIDYHVIAWNRNGSAEPDSHITYFERRAEYGKRIANIPNKIAWMLFVVKEILRNRKNCTLIHACDIDAIIPALFIGKILGKTVVFDIFDWISSLTGKGIIYKIVELVQNLSFKWSDHVILCEEERKKQARTTNKNVHVLPNIPDSKTEYDTDTLEITQRDLHAYKYVISYVGIFDRDRGLENLLQVVSERPEICLNIAGFGVLEDIVNRYAKKYANIKCWGRVEYPVGQAIQKNSSLIAAMYYLTSPLHKYAAPNKYYESLILEVPMITTEKTLVGAKVRKYDTGFVLDETKEALSALLDQDELSVKIKVKSQHCHDVWNTIYCNYYDSFMKNEYLKMMR